MKIMATANVVELMQAKITKQPKELKELLQLVACLGASFTEELVAVASIFPKSEEVDDTAVKKFNEVLSLAVDESFLECQGTLRDRWVHDSVQAAAMQQVSDDERITSQFAVGKALIQNLTERELDINILMVTNLLNTTECPEEDKLSIAKLNLKRRRYVKYVWIVASFFHPF